MARIFLLFLIFFSTSVSSNDIRDIGEEPPYRLTCSTYETGLDLSCDCYWVIETCRDQNGTIITVTETAMPWPIQELP